MNPEHDELRDAPSLRVAIAGGTVEGAPTASGVCFLGVPYAKPPVGSLRFEPPQPASPWEGVRRATSYAAASYQFDLSNRDRVAALVSAADPGLPGVLPFPPAFMSDIMLESSSEDCLYLDIYVPETSTTTSLPVYVYFHGGANVTNSASGRHEYQRGQALAEAEGVIVVQPQYRNGALGWVHFGLVDPSMSNTVNLGLRDQIAALRWVADNISAFGGDPDNITIGGESAGATAVSHLIALPETRQLVRRAILQSLSPFNTWCTQQKPEARAVAQVYVDVLGGSPRDADPDEFLALQNIMLRVFPADSVSAWRPHGGVVDGDVIHELPALHLSESEFDGPLEVMIGFAKDEWQFFRGHVAIIQEADRGAAIHVLAQVFGPQHAASAFDGYASLYPDRSPGHLLSDMLSFVYFKLSSLEIARHLSKLGHRVCVFQYSYDHPGLGGHLRALHTGTMPFVFRSTTPEQRRAFRSLEGADVDELNRIATEFGSMYGSFIRGQGPGSQWDWYDADHESVLWFGRDVESRPALLRAERIAFGSAGISTVRELEEVLLAQLRRQLPAALAPVVQHGRQRGRSIR